MSRNVIASISGSAACRTATGVTVERARQAAPIKAAAHLSVRRPRGAERPSAPQPAISRPSPMPTAPACAPRRQPRSSAPTATRARTIGSVPRKHCRHARRAPPTCRRRVVRDHRQRRDGRDRRRQLVASTRADADRAAQGGAVSLPAGGAGSWVLVGVAGRPEPCGHANLRAYHAQR